MAAYSHIIWDWNGTLFDDAAWCMSIINGMLGRRGLPELPDLAAYQGVFGFPIIDYYRRAGFDFTNEPFEALAAEFISLYHADNTGRCGLRGGAEAVLQGAAGKGVRQVILSASKVENLAAQVAVFGIEPYFDEMLGISDIYAKSKVDIGRAFMARVNPAKALMIGDTAHDAEVARAMGVDCVLLEGGHHARGTLLGCGVPVLGTILSVLDIL